MKATTALAFLPFAATLVAATIAAVHEFSALEQRVGVLEYWQRYYGVSEPLSVDERRFMDEEEWRGHTDGSHSR